MSWKEFKGILEKTLFFFYFFIFMVVSLEGRSDGSNSSVSDGDFASLETVN